MTVAEAAASLGVSPSRVRQFLMEGLIVATKRPRLDRRGGQEWVIEPGELDKVRDRKTTRGRAAKGG